MKNGVKNNSSIGQIIILHRTVNLLIKYVFDPIFGVLLCLGEACGRIEYVNYQNLPLWEGKVILAFAGHNSWLDVALVHHIYFPWWFRELGDDLSGWWQEFHSFFKNFFQWLIDERVELRFRVVNQTALSKDVPVLSADQRNLRAFRFLVDSWVFFVNRKKGGERDRAASYRFARRTLKAGGRPAIFVEGGMQNSADESQLIYDNETRQPILRTIKPGAVQLAIETGAKLVPVRLMGTDKVLPRWKFPFPRFWNKIIIIICEPITFSPDMSVEEGVSILTQRLVDSYYRFKESKK